MVGDSAPMSLSSSDIEGINSTVLKAFPVTLADLAKAPEAGIALVPNLQIRKLRFRQIMGLDLKITQLLTLHSMLNFVS